MRREVRSSRATLCCQRAISQAGPIPEGVTMRAILWSSIFLVVACRPSSVGYLTPPGGNDHGVSLGGLGPQVSRALQASYRKQLEHVPPPVSLVPSDGSELELRGLVATVTVQGPLAHTELHFTFHNAENRVREGRFAITLPAGAAVARFAMQVNGEWREARVVSRLRGRQVYETFLHKNVDPALLEQDAGNQFSARVFPIPGSSNKEIIIGYEHEVSESQPYTLALQGLPAIPRLTIAIDQDGATRSLDRSKRAPEDLVLPVAAGNAAVASPVAFIARLDLPEAEARAAAIDSVLILIDTSASRAPLMGRQVDFVRRLVAALPTDTTVAIQAFDQGVTELYRGPAQHAGNDIDRVLEHGALGASDLGRALDAATTSGMSRLIIVGDGTATLGDSDSARLASRLAVSSIERVDAIQIGQSIDRTALQLLVRAGKQPGAILDGRDPSRVARQLATALPRELAIRVDGVEKVWPATTRGVAPGEPIFVAGLRSSTAPLSIWLGEHRVIVTATAGDSVRVRRKVARAELAELTERMQETKAVTDRTVIRKQIEAVALAHNLVSTQTSLLILETTGDEDRLLGNRTKLTAEEANEAAANAARNAPQQAVAGVTISGTTSVESSFNVDGVSGETISISGRAPMIDQGSTHTGLTITRDYVRNISVSRTYHGVLRGRSPDVGTMSPLAQDYYARWMHTYPLDLPIDPSRDGGSQPGMQVLKHETPYTGEMNQVMSALAHNDRDRGLDLATSWQLASPGDVASIIALGEALEARGATVLAARAYGSLLDMYPNRAELLRVAGERIDRVAGSYPAARAIAIDAYRRAIAERPDHTSTYRLLAYALLRDGKASEALDVVLSGLVTAGFPKREVLVEDAKIIGATLIRQDPASAVAVSLRLAKAHISGSIASKPSLEVVLTWETDANDVDLHIEDPYGGHSSYDHRTLESGGTLLADITDGYGPEMFSVNNPRAFPYQVSAHYFSRGAMGLGLGTVQVIRHDGHGKVTIEDRPFLIQKDEATVDLGVIR